MNGEREHQTITTDWQLDVTGKLGELLSEVRNIVKRLDTLNGSVGRHEIRFTELAKEFAEHPAECPLNKRMNIVELMVNAQAASAAATEREGERWTSRLKPFAILAMTLLVGMFLGHARDLLKILEK